MHSRSLLRFLVPGVVLAVVAGCDPKLGLEEEGTGGGVDTPDPVVTQNALTAGSIVSMHNAILQGGLSVADAFSGAGPVPRSFPATCMAITSLGTSPASYSVDLDGCSNAQGTAFSGLGTFEVADGQSDGFTFYPDFTTEDVIRARNETEAGRNHDISQGTLVFTFERNGSDEITGMTIGSTLRHLSQGETITVSYPDVSVTGSPASFNDQPDLGSQANVTWNGVGVFEVNFAGNGTATYTISGVLYSVALASGEVTIAGS